MASPPTSPSKSSASGSLALTEELRHLFDRGEHESVVSRSEQHLKRKRVVDPSTRALLESIRLASLLHLGRFTEATTALAALKSQHAPPASDPLLAFAGQYLAWADGDGAATAADKVKDLPGEDARKLEAQLLYRSGEYAAAAAIYEDLLADAKRKLDEKKRPAATSRWRLPGRAAPAEPPVTRAELDRLADVVNEIATNAVAAGVLGGDADRARQIAQGVQAGYELEYNGACANIVKGDYSAAEVGLEKAQAIVRAEVDEEEDDLEEALAPIMVQMAYLRHLRGEVKEAEGLYAGIMADRKADPASLAVAANNVTVALGQLAFGKRDALAEGRDGVEKGAAENKPVLPKEQHDALVEGLKKMRATSGRNVERKLALNQRRAMARNRAILLVQMGRHDACRAELAKLKTEFPNDPLVPLIEASLVAKQGNLETADKVLSGRAGDDDVVRAARVQLAAANGDGRRAAALLQELFSGQPAAVVTAASLLEQNGDVDGATDLLKDLVKKCSASDAVSAKKALSGVLLRNAKYEEAAAVLRDVCKANPSDSVAQAELVVATSHFDAEEAEHAAMLLPTTSATHGEVDVKQLEALPPPKRKNIAARQNPIAAKAPQPEEDDVAARAAAVRERKKKKRKKRLPKNFDPNGPPPDPERWLPKTLRSGYKKKKAKDQNNFRGSQGADAAAAEVAATKNAERSAAKAVAAASDGPLPPSGRSKLQRKKKNRR